MAYGKKSKDDNENKGRGRKGPKPMKGARKEARKQKRQEKKAIKSFKKAVDRINKQQSFDPSNPPSREGVILDGRTDAQIVKSFIKSAPRSEQQPTPPPKRPSRKQRFEEEQKKIKRWQDNWAKPPDAPSPALKAPGMKATQSQDAFKPSERDMMHATDFGKRSVNKNPSMKVIGKELAAGAKIAADKIKKEKGMSTTDKGIMSRYGGAEAASVTRRKGGGMVRPPRRKVKRK